ncbi:hypothetical protein ABD76_00175 [Paenibacillus dendritiformis]|nr:hypothetical protein [Paenibacillus dendritiformis]
MRTSSTASASWRQARSETSCGSATAASTTRSGCWGRWMRSGRRLWGYRDTCSVDRLLSTRSGRMVPRAEMGNR